MARFPALARLLRTAGGTALRAGRRAVRAGRRVLRWLDPAQASSDELLSWPLEADFLEVIEEGLRRCDHGPSDRYYVAKELLLSLGRLDADTAECGVYRGLGSYVLCRYAARMPRCERFQHHGFDSFEGLSDPGTHDAPDRPGVRAWTKGDMAAPLDLVRATLADFPWVVLHAGWIPACFEGASDRRFAFVHVDVDLYEPTREALDFFHPRLLPGGIVLFDDYGFLTCPGARRAVDEFLGATGERLVRLPTGQAYFTRSR
ncbi:MAG: class I SAM-dependent methyltransferase [Planctomycetes bacterium]|nr:class I SAM-dependent methyltransferase [Planctomycetota bacterium]